MYRFQHTDYLVAGLLIPVMIFLYWMLVRWKKRTAKKIGDHNLVREITRNHSPQLFALKFVLVLLAFSAGVLALANLRSPAGSAKVNRNGIDVMIALDVSKSMLARDVQPSRLERAKQLVNKLIDKLSNDRIGIVVFAGKAYMQMPLTGDHSAAKMYMSAASTDAVPTQGTVLGDALKMSFAAFNAKEKKYKAVVLISDGEDHDEGALSVAGQMADEGIMINTVGIGSKDGSTIMDEYTNEVKKDKEGNVVITRINEKELMDIAEKGNGIYQLYNNTDDVVNNLSDRLATMDQRTVTEDSLINYRTYFYWFLLLALVLLVLEFFMGERRKTVATPVPARKPLLALLLMTLCGLPSFAQGDKALIKKGNDAYTKKDYTSATENYKKVTERSAGNATAQYNLGNALYRSSKADEAVAAYDNAARQKTSPEERAKAFYNKGVVLQNNKKLPECIDAYKQALKLKPDDEDARQNLQKALIQQQQQQKKEENKDKEKEKKDKKQEQQDQKKKQDQEKQEQPKPQPSKISKQDAEEKLKALMEQEKNLQDKMRRMNTGSSGKPDKDW